MNIFKKSREKTHKRCSNHKGTGSRSCFRLGGNEKRIIGTWDDQTNDENTADVENYNTPKCSSNGSWDVFAGVFSLKKSWSVKLVSRTFFLTSPTVTWVTTISQKNKKVHVLRTHSDQLSAHVCKEGIGEGCPKSEEN
jgi:hypothetical protein